MYSLVCSNVYTHNRDDHINNFTFIYNEEQQSWILSPAYDLTYSNSPGGEHATSINGNEKKATLADLLTLADRIGIKESKAKEIAEVVRETIHEEPGNAEQYHQ